MASSSSTALDRRDALGEADAVVPRTGISIYGCGRDEAVVFREVAPRFGVTPTIIDTAVSEVNIGLAIGNRCISVGHKTPIANSTLRSLSEAGVAYISTRSTGHDHIDVDFARSVGISVEGVVYSPDGVADYTLMLMLMALRNARSIITRAEAHDFRLNRVRGRELRDMTVGVIGTGRIGAAVVDRLRGFGCRVLAYDRNPKTTADYVDLDELLQRSDLVTLHTPLSAETRHLLDRQRFEQMKHGAIIVNTGRGSLLDTESLLSALESGKLGGAALDVLEGEEGIFYTDRRNRPIESRLVLRLQRLPNVLITPHTAYFTEHALRDTVENTILNCLEFEGRAA
ncbi:lactate dehydrogenase [Agromyces sp. ISL-38]|uniref:D-isomer specific 2-hydroxyacid dehydrogenase family protein n=1 Tax=Agromyces sp. ISL-38 TaxID=2819107 RepID=UPI001BE6A7E6|nr:lactate dehydrogenase [Agromyces sp. ISL-38]MBT2517323.1 D-lactate dehydrogenase VanH-Sc [Streptomyces sp. ISL-90]